MTSLLAACLDGWLVAYPFLPVSHIRPRFQSITCLASSEIRGKKRGRSRSDEGVAVGVYTEKNLLHDLIY